VPALSKIFWIPAECSDLICRYKMGNEIQGEKRVQTEKYSDSESLPLENIFPVPMFFGLFSDSVSSPH